VVALGEGENLDCHGATSAYGLAVIPGHVIDEREPHPEVVGVKHHNAEEALMAHRTARLNVFGRELLVTRGA